MKEVHAYSIIGKDIECWHCDKQADFKLAEEGGGNWCHCCLEKAGKVPMLIINKMEG